MIATPYLLSWKHNKYLVRYKNDVDFDTLAVLVLRTFCEDLINNNGWL